MKLVKTFEDSFKQFVYGAIDGTVTTFAAVAGAYGAGLSAKIVLIIGLANLFGDGFSMGASAYVSDRSDQQQRIRATHRYHDWYQRSDKRVRHSLLTHFTRDYGFDGQQLDRALDTAMQNEGRIINHLMREEYGADIRPKSLRDSLRVASKTFIGFVLAGSAPLLSYFTGLFVKSTSRELFYTSVTLTALTFLGIGYLKGRVTATNTKRAMIETLVLGGIAAGLAFLLGDFLAKALGA